VRCTSRLSGAVKGEPAAGEHLEVMGPRATGDEHQLLASRGTKTQLDRTLRFSRLEKCTSQIHRCLGRVKALVEIPAQVDGLLSRRERKLDVARVERCSGGPRRGPWPCRGTCRRGAAEPCGGRVASARSRPPAIGASAQPLDLGKAPPADLCDVQL